MRKFGGLAVALALAGAANAEPSKPPASNGPLSGPTHFVNGRKDPALLAMIRRGMSHRIDFDGRFSSSTVSCGAACNSFWFVDRRTGGVVAAPESQVADEFTWDIATKPDSDLVQLVVGPRDGVGAQCARLRYRWNGNAFVATGKRSWVKCPG